MHYMRFVWTHEQYLVVVFCIRLRHILHSSINWPNTVPATCKFLLSFFFLELSSFNHKYVHTTVVIILNQETAFCKIVLKFLDFSTSICPATIACY